MPDDFATNDEERRRNLMSGKEIEQTRCVFRMRPIVEGQEDRLGRNRATYQENASWQGIG
jgi:hypothetical protein